MLEDESMFGDCRFWLEILTVCWGICKSELIFIADSICKDSDADNVSTDDSNNEFDA